MVRKFTSLYKEDPIAEELEAGIRGTDVYQGSPYALGNIPGFEGMKYATPDYNKYADLYNLYLGGGFDAAQDDFVTPGPAAPIGGGGGGGTGTTIGGTGGVNTPEEQRLIDAGIGLQVAPGQPVFAPGEEPVTQADIDAFNQTPVNTEYKSPYDTGDANVAEQFYIKQRADKARADERAANIREQYGAVGQYQDPTPTYYDTRKQADLERAGGELGGSDAGFYPQSTYDARLEDEFYTTPSGLGIGEGEVIPKQPTTFGTPVDVEQGFTGDFSVPGAPGVDPMEKMDFVSGADVANPKTLLDKLGLSQLNPVETAVKAAFNIAIGKPVSVLYDLLRGLLPKMDPRQKELRKFYNLDDIGRVAEGELMAGYNPVYGGFPGVSEPTYGLQEAYDKRINTIEETLAKQKADGKTQSQDLIDRLAELKEAKEKEKARLDLFSGDVDERDQMLEDIVAQNKAEAEGDAIRLRQLTGDLDLDKQATIPLSKDPLITTEDLGRTYQDEKTALPIWIPEKEEQDLQEEIALEKELAAAEAREAARRAEINRQNEQREGGGGGGGQPQTGGGGYERDEGGGGYSGRGYHWAQGGRVQYGLGSLRKRRY